MIGEYNTYTELCHIDEDYIDECPSIIIEDWDAVYHFMLDRINRFGNMYPCEHLEYYQLKGNWVSGDGIIDLYKENSRDGLVLRLYKRD